MSYGLSVKNNNNEFLISSEMRNLHHFATITNPSITVETNLFGGLTRFTYTVTGLSSSVPPVPFFTTPFADRFYAVTRVVNTSGTNWTIELISSGGFPTTTDNGTNPSGSQLVEDFDGPFYSKANNGISTASTDKYALIVTPSSTSATFTGTGKYTVVWNGTKVLDDINIGITNGVPQLFDGGGTASSDDNLYFARESSANVEPSSITDNPSATETISGSRHYFFRVIQQYYELTSGSSGNAPSGSYGSAQIPKLVVFTDARAVSSTETYGLRVFKSDGTSAFDSRKKPLLVRNTITVTHPSTASGASGSGLSARNAGGPISTWSNNFTPSQFTNNTVSTMPTNAMFLYTTVTQVHQQASRTEVEEECDGFDIKGNCVGGKRFYTWRSTYWVFYRGGIKRVSTTRIDSGYIMDEYNAYHSRTTQSSFFGVSGVFSSGGFSEAGKWPWDSGQINASGTGINTIVIADATNYV